MKVFAEFLTRLVFVLCVVVATPAWALGDGPLLEKLNPKCIGTNITGEKFLDMFYAIAMHGDLTDVPFIEKTLETKFDVKYFNSDDGKGHKYKRAQYYKKSLFNGPMWVTLEFDVERDPAAIYSNSIGRIDFDGRIECLGIAKAAFNKKFGWPDRAPDAVLGGNHGTSESITQPLGAIGKDGTELKVGYGYNGAIENPLIYRPLIIQYKHINSR